MGTGTTIRVSVGVGGVQATGPSFVGHVDDSGTRFTWESDAQNLVPDDGDGHRDGFFRSHQLGGTTERVSVDPAGGDADAEVRSITLSGDGTRVAFSSNATDLVVGDANGATDVFVRDLATDTTKLVSARPGTQGNGPSDAARIADNGRVVFESEASNLVTGDTNGVFDVFVAGEVCDRRLVTVDMNGPSVASTNGADVILGTPGADTIDGRSGADRFCGGGGNDVFRGGPGADRAFGGTGKDTLKGQDGNDAAFGGAGNDVLEGGNGNDLLNGGADQDTCKGQAGVADTGRRLRGAHRIPVGGRPRAMLGA